LAANWRDGRIKQSTIARILAVRKSASKLFSKGSYVPLETIGPLAAHIVAFARMFDGDFAITAASRLCVRLLSDESSLAPHPSFGKAQASSLRLFFATRFAFPRCIAAGKFT
jgi:maltooligosyltrehalose synthase